MLYRGRAEFRSSGVQGEPRCPSESEGGWTSNPRGGAWGKAPIQEQCLGLGLGILRPASPFGRGEPSPFGPDGAALNAVGRIHPEGLLSGGVGPPFIDIRRTHIDPGLPQDLRNVRPDPDVVRLIVAAAVAAR